MSNIGTVLILSEHTTNSLESLELHQTSPFICEKVTTTPNSDWKKGICILNTHDRKKEIPDLVSKVGGNASVSHFYSINATSYLWNITCVCKYTNTVGAEECVLKKYGRWLLDHIQYPISWSLLLHYNMRKIYKNLVPAAIMLCFRSFFLLTSHWSWWLCCEGGTPSTMAKNIPKLSQYPHENKSIHCGFTKSTLIVSISKVRGKGQLDCCCFWREEEKLVIQVGESDLMKGFLSINSFLCKTYKQYNCRGCSKIYTDNDSPSEWSPWKFFLGWSRSSLKKGPFGKYVWKVYVDCGKVYGNWERWSI